MSQFCKDCKHAKEQYGSLKCERTREHFVDRVTGDKWSSAHSCSYMREYRVTCPDFEQRSVKATLLQRLKEVFS